MRGRCSPHLRWALSFWAMEQGLLPLLANESFWRPAHWTNQFVLECLIRVLTVLCCFVFKHGPFAKSRFHGCNQGCFGTRRRFGGREPVLQGRTLRDCPFCSYRAPSQWESGVMANVAPSYFFLGFPGHGKSFARRDG